MENVRRRDFLGILGVSTAQVSYANLSLADNSKQNVKRPLKTKIEIKGKTFKNIREDGRSIETAGFLQSYMKNMQPALAFNPNMKAKDIPGWQQAVREKILELMCFPEGFPEQPQPKLLWSKQRDGYQLQKWEAYPEPFCVVPFLMLIPDGTSSNSKAPAVMCFPGSTSSKESLAGEPELKTGKPGTKRHWNSNKQALFYVKKGIISVAVENPATNELSSGLRSRGSMSDCALWMGRNYLGISVFQKSRILKWLSNLQFVDSNRIATSGHSLGSNPADILGVLYPDLVKAVVHNDFVCNWHERAIVMNCQPPGGPHHTVPDLFKWFDHTDLEASLAPRPLLFTEGGRSNQINKIRQAYRLLNAENQMQVYHYAKYDSPAKRLFDGMKIQDGLTVDEYFQYANVDPEKHRFRPERAVPWLSQVFGL